MVKIVRTESNKDVARVPDYKGDGVAVWINKDKNGKDYLSIVLLNSIKCAAFEYIPKQ